MKRAPVRYRRTPLAAQDTTGLAAAIYGLELKRRNLRRRYASLTDSLRTVMLELADVEAQIVALQAQHRAALGGARLTRDEDDDSPYTVNLGY